MLKRKEDGEGAQLFLFVRKCWNYSLCDPPLRWIKNGIFYVQKAEEEEEEQQPSLSTNL